MIRRPFLRKLAVLPFFVAAAAVPVAKAEYGAKFGNPKIFVSLVEWADEIITE